MITLRPGSHVWRLLLLLAICGEYPHRSLHLLGSVRTLESWSEGWKWCSTSAPPPGQTSATCKMLTTSGRGNRRTIRLYKSALSLLQALHPAALSWYLAATGGHRFSGSTSHVERNHRVAESVAICMGAGVETRPFLLPPPAEAGDPTGRAGICCFYPAKSVKQLDNTEMSKTIFTRLTGAIFSPGYCYAV